MDNIEEGISDDLLQKASEDIQKLLRKRGLSESDRVQLEVQSYFLMFLINDHKKIGKMYPFFKSESERRERNKAWWERVQWIIIPLVVTGTLAFVGQFVYFWLTLVPDLQKVIK
jgi:hypothetical protein